MKPSDLYQQHALLNNFQADPAQQQAVQLFDDLQQALLLEQHRQQDGFQRLKALFTSQPTPPTGLYIWGGVGRGKTWMMDLFFDALPLQQKIRLHFHHFMRGIHDQLTLLKGQRNPLKLVARQFARRYRLLCLDEFHVADITDAMLLYGLLEALFQEGVCLVATSNQPPGELYKNGLQRDRFLPAIDLLEQHTRVVNIDGGIDHRLRLLEQADTWYDSRQPDTESRLRRRFAELAPSEVCEQVLLHINYRNLQARFCADDLVWFDYSTLCDGPRAAADYIEIARRFHTLFLSAVPVMDESTDDLARRFVNMIDEFYDRNLKLIVSAAADPHHLYEGQQLAFEFERTASRLEEMRSHAYLARPHKP
jgi:cell division protein ZapE